MRLVCRIAEARHPVIRVVHRMVDAVRPVESDTTRRNTEMMIEAGEVRAATQITERQRGRITVVRLQPDVVDGARAHRIGHDTSHGAQQRLERWGSGAAEVRAGEGAILIDVRHDVGAQRILELLDPLRRADEAPLLRIPGGEDDAAGRSEEHTSELQSRLHLVCRLLLEKKKKKKRTLNTTQNSI